ncbi:zinc-binding metallopeptidase family protein [Rubrivivax gelatinosus]|uniref:Zinc-ribbon domain-containing protein n=1 Tax=Rubrivivax gelatinosus TaxID=28068 RepID=A0A4R2MI72_RUBGE|nr:putative zinc-binding metallopeptidase [Rubrivivax gelatinosus]TCP04364.1 hypothetical protein EV684_102117 [Rubrivivax gelatinosus]
MAAVPEPITPRKFECVCARPVFFRNSECLVCHTPLGYDPERRRLLPLEPIAGTDLWKEARPRRPRRYRRCANLDAPSACNWLVDPADAGALDPPQCRACRLTRTLPDLSQPGNGERWGRIATAQRRLVSQLVGLGLPVKSRLSEDPDRGLVFDLLQSPPGGPAVVTGHADGIVTIDVEEADDPTREHRRTTLGETYRTLLGHLRHEVGHYYWQRLVEGSPWHEPFRRLFGDERGDYAAALKRHYDEAAPADWGARHVSAYASSHPWEDWAETWAHYLHMLDTLDTARSFGLDGESVELSYERFGNAALADSGDRNPGPFLAIVNGWMELTGVLNELSRSMGVPDFYPFVLSVPALRKLHFVHRVVGVRVPTAAAEPAARQELLHAQAPRPAWTERRG